MAPTSSAAGYLTAKQLAESLRVTTDTALKWARAGLVPSVRIGRTVRFDAERVRQALQEQRTR